MVLPSIKKMLLGARGRENCQGIKKSLSDYVSPIPHTRETVGNPKGKLLFPCLGRCLQLVDLKSRGCSRTTLFNAATLSRGRLSFKVSRIYARLLLHVHLTTLAALQNPTSFFSYDDKYTPAVDDLAKRIKENIAS